MKYEAIYEYSSEFSVRKMCKVLEIKTSSYYRWKQSEVKRNIAKREELMLIRKVEKTFNDSDKTYGYRTVYRQLCNEGVNISQYKVRKIMRENGFYPLVGIKRRPIKSGKCDGKYYKNLLKQNFKAEDKNQVWVGDITYIKTRIGWVYLAAVMDLYNREIIGYSVSKKCDTELVKRALYNSISKNGKRDGLIFHSDRGSQYASKGYQKLLSENNIIGSMSKPGCPYDNSCMESFFATLKKCRIYRREYADIQDVKYDIFEFIEIFYNRKRLHSILGYVSPVAYRLKKMHCIC